MPTIEPRETSLDLLCREILQLYSTASNDVSFQYIPDRQIPLLWIDPDQIKRALINLFDNANDTLKGIHTEAPNNPT